MHPLGSCCSGWETLALPFSPLGGGSSEPYSNCFPNQGQSEANLTSTAPFPRSLVNNYFPISVRSSLKSGKTILQDSWHSWEGSKVLWNHHILEIISQSFFMAECRVLLPISQEAKLRLWRQMVEIGLEPTSLWLLVWTAKPWSLLKSVLKYCLSFLFVILFFPSSPLSSFLSSCLTPFSLWISSPHFLPLSYLKWCCFIFVILSLEITVNFNKCKWQRNPESDTWTKAGDSPVSAISSLP